MIGQSDQFTSEGETLVQVKDSKQKCRDVAWSIRLKLPNFRIL